MSRKLARAGVCAVACLGTGAAALPSAAGAAAHGPHRLTISVNPNPAFAGDPVVIQGRLFAPKAANRLIQLYTRFASGGKFRLEGTTRADATGRYVFSRIHGVVTTNRDWKVVAYRNQSRTVRERVHALVTLTGPSGQSLTNAAQTFTGRVTPGRGRLRVTLQRQVSDTTGNIWQTIRGARSVTRRDGTYTIRTHLRTPDTYTIRALFNGNRFNLGGVSDSVDVDVAQVQNPNLTLTPSTALISVGQAVTLTGKLAGAAPAGHTVALLGHEHGQPFSQLATAKTAADGSFTFTQVPPHTTAYQVRSDDAKQSAVIVEAVQDVLTAAADRANAVAGTDAVTFSGTVAPSHPGHEIALQHLGIDGRWHTVATSAVTSAATYSLRHVVQSPGAQQFRIRLQGGPLNWGTASAPITVTVAAPKA